MMREKKIENTVLIKKNNDNNNNNNNNNNNKKLKKEIRVLAFFVERALEVYLSLGLPRTTKRW